MLTPSEIELLNTFARELARLSFEGKGKVARGENGVVRLMLMRRGRNGAGSVYRMSKKVNSPDFDTASTTITQAVESAHERAGSDGIGTLGLDRPGRAAHVR
jgi:hypothetical protein